MDLLIIVNELSRALTPQDKITFYLQIWVSLTLESITFKDYNLKTIVNITLYGIKFS